MLCQITKAEKLWNLGLSVLTDPSHSSELHNLMQKLNLTQIDVLKAYVDYDLDIFSITNDVYKPLLNRFVLYMHNLLKESWHIEIQQVVSNLIKQVRPRKIIDLGFGVPSLYVKDSLVSPTFHLTLCDKELFAFTFADSLLTLWSPKWQENIAFLQADMIDIAIDKTDYDLYLFQDSIEHTQNPTNCLKSYVVMSHLKSKFLLTLPLGPIIPMHAISWNNRREADEWLKKCGLQPDIFRLVQTNPEVDLFANSVEGGFTEYIVLCDKL